MKQAARIGFAALACAWGFASPAWSQEAQASRTGAGAALVGQDGLAPAVQVAGQMLKLNGKGVRYRALVKVYEIGIYASVKVNSLEQFLAAPGAKRLQLVTLRALTGDALGIAMVQGMQDNASHAERTQLLDHMGLLAKVFGAEPRVPAGSVLTIDQVPGRGTVLTLNGVQKGAIADPIFFPAAARIWLGSKPVDYLLKNALLGIETWKPEAG